MVPLAVWPLLCATFVVTATGISELQTDGILLAASWWGQTAVGKDGAAGGARRGW